MTANELLTFLQSRGVTVIADGDRLTLKDASRLLPPEMRVEVAAKKAELLELLRTPRRRSRVAYVPDAGLFAPRLLPARRRPADDVLLVLHRLAASQNSEAR